MPSLARRYAGLIPTTLLLACGGAARTTTAIDASTGLRTEALDPSDLVVTSGEITRLSATRFETRSGAMRAQLAAKGSAMAELRFLFLGPTATDVPLASGEIRRQIGIKLRAQDSCNVVYAMWHIAPSRGLDVSVKANPGQQRASECGDRGYQFLEPRAQREVPDIEADSKHTLRAGIVGSELQVYVDEQLSWAAELPTEAFAFDGPVGVRSDNGIFDVEVRVGDAPNR